MMKEYKKLIEMETEAILKYEKYKKELEELKNILYIDKKYIVKKLIEYLRIVLNEQFSFYRIIDYDYNVADILVKKNSNIFKSKIKDFEFVSFYVEDLINNKKFNNKDEIIILDISYDENLLNLKYLCDSLEYKNLSYSEDITNILNTFVGYILRKKIY